MTTAGLMLFSLLVGMALVEFCVHRPDRRKQAAAHAEVLAAKDTTIEHAQARADNAEHSRDLAEDRARLAESLHDDTAEVLRGTTVQLQEWAKFHPLPTIAGTRVDVLAAIDSLVDGQVHRVDFGAVDNPPIFAETLAGVTPITAAKKGRAK